MTPVPTREIDREVWQKELNDFVPAKLYDAHAHIFRTDFDRPPTVEAGAWSTGVAASGFAHTDMALWQEWNAALFPDREVHGFCMGFPFVHADLEQMNRFVADEAHKDAGSAPLMIVKPGMSPKAVEEFAVRHDVIGFKPYRVYSRTGDAVECSITDYLPEELIDVANRLGLTVILHLSKRRAAADPQNLADLTRFNREYPRVKWQLAHCARCFIPSFLEESIDTLAGLENVWYDVSAVCESDVFDVLFSRGPRERIMFGSDNLPAGAERGKYIAFGYAWATLTETNHRFNLSHCQADPTWVIYEELRGLRRVMRRLGMSQTERDGFFYGNAARLLSMVGR